MYTDPGKNVSIPCIHNLTVTTNRADWIINGRRYVFRQASSIIPSKYKYYNKHLMFTAEFSDDGVTFQCVIIIDGADVFSENATLHILPQGQANRKLKKNHNCLKFLTGI